MIIKFINRKYHFDVAIIGGGCGGINLAGHLNRKFNSFNFLKKIAIF